MGVDFFDCDQCGDSICDAGDYWSCEECGHTLCIDCEADLVEGDDDDKDICPFCEKKTATDSQLLTYALEKLILTRDQLFEQYKGDK